MRKTEKISYELDSYNRLVRYSQVLDGTFKIDENNTLIYYVKRIKGSSTPRQIKFSGDYALDKEHNLILTLNKDNSQRTGERLTIKGELIDAKDNELLFAVSTKDSAAKTHVYTLKLGGRWQADKYNRFTFLATKQKGSPNELTWQGSWEVNKQNEIVYTYKKTYLKRKEKLERSITLKGYWDITDKNRISYVLNKEIGSRFDFKISFARPLSRGMQYEIGIGAAPSKKTMTLFGKWKVNKRFGLSFEMPCREGKIRSLKLGATYKLGDSEAFIEALKSKKEISFFVGGGFRW